MPRTDARPVVNYSANRDGRHACREAGAPGSRPHDNRGVMGLFAPIDRQAFTPFDRRNLEGALHERFDRSTVPARAERAMLTA